MLRLSISVAGRWVGLLILAAAALPSTAGAQIKDKQVFAGTNLEAGWDAIDRRKSMRWEGDGWIGNDTDKFRWKTEGELERGTLEEAELQFLYSRSISQFFDALIGLRYDFAPRGATFAVIGVQGLAPQWFEVGAALFIDHAGHVSARLEVERDILITQRLILKPFVELNFAASEVARRSIGPGLTELETGIQLRYEIRRELAPFVEFRYSRQVGRTSDLARAEGEEVQDVSVILGLKVSF